MTRASSIIVCALMSAAPCATPVASQALQTSTRAEGATAELGDLPTSVVGKAGQRLGGSTASAAPSPFNRIDTRVHNRVQSRISNRIDQNYDPQANAADPFALAEDTARVPVRPR